MLAPAGLFVVATALAAACGETGGKVSKPDCDTVEAETYEAAEAAGVPTWGPPGASGGGEQTFVSEVPRIADDMGALRRLKPTRLPLAGICVVREDVQTNHAGRPLFKRARLLVATRGRRVYAVPTSDGDVFSYLEPQGISIGSGTLNGVPRLYSFYHYDDGRPHFQRRLVVFGLVPDKVRQVNVLVRCRPYAAVTANGGFYYERRGQSASDISGFVYGLRGGKVQRQANRGDCTE